MNILMLNYEFPPVGGGGAPISFELSRELVRRGHSVDVVTMHAPGTKRFEIVDGIKIFRIPALRRKREICHPHEMATYIISAIPFCMRLLRKKRYDLIHTHFIFPTGIVGVFLKWRYKLPLVLTSLGSDVPRYNPDRFRILHKLLHPLWQKIVHQVDVLVSPSNYFRDLIHEFTNFPVTVIPIGFRPGIIRPSIRKRKILVVSRIFPRKGVQYFLRAIEDLDLPGWEVIIAGDGPYLDQLKKQAEHVKPRVNFMGFVQGEQLYYLYETSSIFVFTSQNDAFGIVLLEAMHAGLAIITANVSAIPDVVADTALLVEPNNPQQIRDALLKLVHDEALREKLGDKGHERAKMFNWPTIAAQYEEVYARAMRKHSKIK